MGRNVELLEKVADKIESRPENWDQAWFTGRAECGTTHCIGGWAAAMTGDVTTDPHRLLGLSFDEGEFLFFNGFRHSNYSHSHKEVAEWLREIARGGDVVETAPEWWNEAEKPSDWWRPGDRQ